ncbi:hypothetical protein FACS1894199_13400 [Bacteroidia bacterium]|nr:hypothetical protein FACS1894199_13400 [Bacteroidia bacterium]
MVFLASFLAKLAGLEDVIGAFLAGLALNRLIPNTSALMNRIEFVGTALFIPFFLIGVGMLSDYEVFTRGWEAVWIAVVMCVVATFGKYLAALIVAKTLHYTKDEQRLMFGLSNSQAAATLAAVMVGYQVIIGTTADGEPIRLLNDNVLNGTVIMILVTCIIASFVTQKGAQNVALAGMTDTDMSEKEEEPDSILIPVSNDETIDELINLGITIKAAKSNTTMIALNIIPSNRNAPSAEKHAAVLLEKAEKLAAATDNVLKPLRRYDSDMVNGIANVVREHKITDMVLGLRKETDISDTFLGKLTDGVLVKCATTTLVYRPVQPLSTVQRYIVIVPMNAERETGFPYWVIRIWNLAQNTGSKMVFYGHRNLLNLLEDIKGKHTIDAEFKEFTDWNDSSMLTAIMQSVKEDDALVVVMSRRGHSSYSRFMQTVPDYMNRYSKTNNCILIYPIQAGVGEDEDSNISLLGHYDEVGGLTGVLGKLFSNKF